MKAFLAGMALLVLIAGAAALTVGNLHLSTADLTMSHSGSVRLGSVQ